MKTKVKITATVASIILVLAVMGIGVFAAVQTSISSANGSIAFNASGVYVSVSGEMTDGAGTDYSERSYSHKNYDSSDMSTPSKDSLPSWDIGNVNLTENNNYVVYTLTLNNDSEFGISVIYTAPSDITGLLITATANGNEVTSGGQILVNAGENTTLFIRASLSDFSKSIDALFSFGLTMAKA